MVQQSNQLKSQKKTVTYKQAHWADSLHMYVNALIMRNIFNCREAKAHNIPKNIGESIPHFGSLLSVKCNCNGTKVSLIINKVMFM